MNSIPTEKNTTDGAPNTSAPNTSVPKSSSFSFNRIMLKAKYSLYSALVFFLFANPETILILQRFFGKFVTFITPGGAPTIAGIFINTGLFFFTMLSLMLLPSE
jgi:hypothetical protein